MIEKMKSIETKELIMAIEELEKERGINKEYLLEILIQMNLICHLLSNQILI